MLTAHVSRPSSLEFAEKLVINTTKNPPAESDNDAVKTPLTVADEARRQKLRENVLIASQLVSKLEQMNYMFAIDALQSMSPARRLSVARTMLGINKQHRRVIESLPLLSLAVLKVGSGEILYHLQITYSMPNTVPAVYSFTFDPEEVCSEMKVAS